MKEVIFLFVLSMTLSSCHGKINNSITDKKEFAKEIDYSDIFYGLTHKKERDSHYFHIWTNVINKKSDQSKHLPLNSILGMIKTDYNETDMIAKIKNLKFKIIPYTKDADEKAIEYIATVMKCYKGHCPKKIHYRISYEMGDTINVKNNFPAIVLLTKYDDAYYLNDQFMYFPANKKLETALGKFIKN